MRARPEPIAWLIGLIGLAYELVGVRMLSFFLNNSMDFLAIPMALFGLAVGSVACHLLFRDRRPQLIRAVCLGLMPLMATSLVVFFAVSNAVFPEVHAGLRDPVTGATKVVVYSAILLPPYAAIGAALAALFGEHPDRIGRLYFFDLLGAGMGCALVPTLLWAAGLGPTLIALLAAACALAWLQSGARWVWAVQGLLLVALAAGTATGVVLTERPDPIALSKWILGRHSDQGITEVAVRWNPIARTALMRAGDSGPFGIVQDHGLSNVRLTPAVPPPGASTIHGLPWRLGHDPKRILVMFAGAGHDLLAFDGLARGTAELVGVELNPAVTGFARHPAVAGLQLAPFLDQPHVQLITREGRSHLTDDPGRYDLIYVANNGAVHSTRTGHTRKFLDTCEAMAGYLAHLEPDGLVVFQGQPVQSKIRCLRELLAPDSIASRVFVFGRARRPDMDTAVLKASGLSDADVASLTAMVDELGGVERVLASPDGTGVERSLRWMSETLDRSTLVTDDRPFTEGLGISTLDWVPSEQQLRQPRYVSAWVRVFTIVLFTVLSLGVATVARLAGGAGSRVPVPWIAFLLASGIGYMFVEVGLIAKTELLVGNPLLSVAINLALFLMASALGANLQDRWRLPAPILAGATVVAVAWAIVGVGTANHIGLAWPLPLKIVAMVAAVGPAGAVLGMFYPLAVQQLVAGRRPEAVPMTYALTTLASVLGSAVAMTAFIDLGFTRVIALGGGFYVLAGLMGWVATRQNS